MRGKQTTRELNQGVESTERFRGVTSIEPRRDLCPWNWGILKTSGPFRCSWQTITDEQTPELYKGQGGLYFLLQPGMGRGLRGSDGCTRLRESPGGQLLHSPCTYLTKHSERATSQRTPSHFMIPSQVQGVWKKRVLGLKLCELLVK